MLRDVGHRQPRRRLVAVAGGKARAIALEEPVAALLAGGLEQRVAQPSAQRREASTRRCSSSRDVEVGGTPLGVRTMNSTRASGESENCT